MKPNFNLDGRTLKAIADCYNRTDKNKAKNTPFGDLKNYFNKTTPKGDEEGFKLLKSFFSLTEAEQFEAIALHIEKYSTPPHQNDYDLKEAKMALSNHLKCCKNWDNIIQYITSQTNAELLLPLIMKDKSLHPKELRQINTLIALIASHCRSSNQDNPLHSLLIQSVEMYFLKKGALPEFKEFPLESKIVDEIVKASTLYAEKVPGDLKLPYIFNLAERVSRMTPKWDHGMKLMKKILIPNLRYLKDDSLIHHFQTVVESKEASMIEDYISVLNQRKFGKDDKNRLFTIITKASKNIQQIILTHYKFENKDISYLYETAKNSEDFAEILLDNKDLWQRLDGKSTLQLILKYKKIRHSLAQKEYKLSSEIVPDLFNFVEKENDELFTQFLLEKYAFDVSGMRIKNLFEKCREEIQQKIVKVWQNLSSQDKDLLIYQFFYADNSFLKFCIEKPSFITWILPYPTEGTFIEDRSHRQLQLVAENYQEELEDSKAQDATSIRKTHLKNLLIAIHDCKDLYLFDPSNLGDHKVNTDKYRYLSPTKRTAVEALNSFELDSGKLTQNGISQVLIHILITYFKTPTPDRTNLMKRINSIFEDKRFEKLANYLHPLIQQLNECIERQDQSIDFSSMVNNFVSKGEKELGELENLVNNLNAYLINCFQSISIVPNIPTDDLPTPSAPPPSASFLSQDFGHLGNEEKISSLPVPTNRSDSQDNVPAYSVLLNLVRAYYYTSSHLRSELPKLINSIIVDDRFNNLRLVFMEIIRFWEDCEKNIRDQIVSDTQMGFVPEAEIINLYLSARQLENRCMPSAPHADETSNSAELKDITFVASNVERLPPKTIFNPEYVFNICADVLTAYNDGKAMEKIKEECTHTLKSGVLFDAALYIYLAASLYRITNFCTRPKDQNSISESKEPSDKATDLSLTNSLDMNTISSSDILSISSVNMPPHKDTQINQNDLLELKREESEKPTLQLAFNNKNVFLGCVSTDEDEGIFIGKKNVFARIADPTKKQELFNKLSKDHRSYLEKLVPAPSSPNSSTVRLWKPLTPGTTQASTNDGPAFPYA